MATNNVFSLHTKGGFDLQDLLGAPMFGVAALVLSGIGTFSIFGYSFSDVLWSGSSASVSVAAVLVGALLALSWFTNRAGDGFDDLDEYESAAVGGGLVILVGVVFVPAVQDLVLGSDAMGVVAFVLLSAAYTVAAWY